MQILESINGLFKCSNHIKTLFYSVHVFFSPLFDSKAREHTETNSQFREIGYFKEDVNSQSIFSSNSRQEGDQANFTYCMRLNWPLTCIVLLWAILGVLKVFVKFLLWYYSTQFDSPALKLWKYEQANLLTDQRAGRHFKHEKGAEIKSKSFSVLVQPLHETVDKPQMHASTATYCVCVTWGGDLADGEGLHPYVQHSGRVEAEFLLECKDYGSTCSMGTVQWPMSPFVSLTSFYVFPLLICSLLGKEIRSNKLLSEWFTFNLQNKLNVIVTLDLRA